jgi:fructokinase
MRIGVDVGGTKIEAIALDSQGAELERTRVATPRGDYEGTLETIAGLVTALEKTTGQTGTIGVGIPGTIVASTGLVKNANSVWLNGKPLQRDLCEALNREVRCANDANCFAISEATDGAAKGYDIVFGVIFGTGCGGGYRSTGESMRARMGWVVNGDTTHYRGRPLRSHREPFVIADIMVVLRRGSPALGSSGTSPG